MKFVRNVVLSFTLISILLFSCQSVCHDNSTDDIQNESNVSVQIDMELWINDNLIPVVWLETRAVKELNEQVGFGQIVIPMSKYGGFEQVGSLGKSYSADNLQVTALCGDVMLYNSSNIVVFYGSNTWSYTRLGKINLSKGKIIEILSQDNITLVLKKKN